MKNKSYIKGIIVASFAPLFLMACSSIPDVSQQVAPVISGTVGGDVNTSTEALTEVVNNYSMDIIKFIIVIFLAGWAIPGPAEMFGGLFNGLMKVFGGLGNFILKLFGKTF